MGLEEQGTQDVHGVPPTVFSLEAALGLQRSAAPQGLREQCLPSRCTRHGVRGAGFGLADHLLLKPWSYGVRPGHTPVGTNLCTIPRVVTLWGE